MQTVRVEASGNYEVRIGAGLLCDVGEQIAELVPGRSAVIVSDSNVWPLYGPAVQEKLRAAGFRSERFVFPAGEASKNPSVLLETIRFFAEKELTREDVVVALGGGVVGDLAGLAAALYLRSVPCVQIPTSLLAMVDSSVGGKTAVDLPEGKNMLGSFTQPRLVLCDTDVLRTLPREVFSEGMAEVIKYGMIQSPALLRLLLEEDAEDVLPQIITHCVELKRDIVARDEQDFGDRQLLNFGHTLGHAVERCRGYEIYHGEGVAIGMGIMTRAEQRRGNCPQECVETLELLLQKYRLPRSTELPEEALLQAAKADKKRRGDSITLVLPRSFGKCMLERSSYETLAELLRLGR